MKKKTLPKLKADLWRLVSEYVRRKDADKFGTVRCYTCGAPKHWKEVDAGHAIGGRTGAVLFDLEILRPQCKKCNMPPECGNYYEFGKRLNLENGEGWYERKKIEANKPVKYNRAILMELELDIKQKLKELEN